MSASVKFKILDKMGKHRFALFFISVALLCLLTPLHSDSASIGFLSQSVVSASPKGNSQKISQVLQDLKSDSRVIVRRGIRNVSMIEGQSTSALVNPLSSILNQKFYRWDSRTRAMSAGALGKVGRMSNRGQRKKIIRVLTDTIETAPNGSIRAATASALGMLGDVSVLPLLENLMETDENLLVVAAAKNAIIHITNSPLESTQILMATSSSSAPDDSPLTEDKGDEDYIFGYSKLEVVNFINGFIVFVKIDIKDLP